MSNLHNHITEALHDARQQKKLSQRELSAKIGISQSHISKIESGTIDPQISNLIELARALDLEVMLVPRPLVPAVHSLTRGTQKLQPAKQEGPGYKELEHIRKTAKRIHTLYPAAFEALKLQNTAEALQRLPLDEDAISKLRKLDENIRNVSKIIEQTAQTHKTLDDFIENQPLMPALDNINQITSNMKLIRSLLAHKSKPKRALSMPDYLWEKGNDDA
jgi:transcriptional regulator with XRE-family HTH domain